MNEKTALMREYTMYAVTNGDQILGSGQNNPHVFWREIDAKNWLEDANRYLGTETGFKIREIRFTLFE